MNTNCNNLFILSTLKRVLLLTCKSCINFQKGDSSSTQNNYCLISILPAFHKVFKEGFFNNLETYFRNKHKPLLINKFEFWSWMLTTSTSGASSWNGSRSYWKSRNYAECISECTYPRSLTVLILLPWFTNCNLIY